MADESKPVAPADPNAGAREKIAAAYQTHLGRPATEAELNWRVAQLTGGNNTPLDRQLMDISGSPEAAAWKAQGSAQEGIDFYSEMIDKALAYQERAAQLAKEGLIEQAKIAADESKRAQETALKYLDTGKKEAQTYYDPYIRVGETGLSSLNDLIAKGVQVPSDITKSPYYDLYAWQKSSQDQAIKTKLAAMGLLKSGPGLTQEIKASTGLDAQLSATEYERARQAYLDKVGLSEKMSDYGFNATQGAANASIGTGSAAATTTMQTGGNLSALASQLGTNLAGVTTQSGQTGASLYGSEGSGVASLMNSSAQQRLGLYSDIYKTDVNADLQRAALNKTSPTGPLDYIRAIGGLVNLNVGVGGKSGGSS